MMRSTKKHALEQGCLIDGIDVKDALDAIPARRRIFLPFVQVTIGHRHEDDSASQARFILASPLTVQTHFILDKIPTLSLTGTFDILQTPLWEPLKIIHSCPSTVLMRAIDKLSKDG